jgi:transcriptional regulator with XRE-family HTH domain
MKLIHIRTSTPKEVNMARKQTLASLLLKTRRERGESMRVAAEALGITEYTYSMWERGAWAIQLDKADRIAKWTKLPRKTITQFIVDAQIDAMQSRAERHAASSRFERGLCAPALVAIGP